MTEQVQSPESMDSKLTKYANLYDREQFQTLNEVMTYGEYIEQLHEKPKLCRNSFQFMLDMILSKGVETFERYRKTYKRYKFFTEDPVSPIFGIEESIDELVNFIRGAAGGYGTERRVLLLHGPVGSSKSTICRVLKRGLEEYSQTDEGAWYTYRWKNLPTEGKDFIYTNATDECPMHQDPLKLMPRAMRTKVLKNLNGILLEQTPEEERKGMYELISEGDLNPRSRLFMRILLEQNNGDWGKVVNEHI